jgi:aspartyl protease family protein
MQALMPGQVTKGDQFDALQLLGFLALVSSGLVFSRQIKLGEAARNIALWVGIAAAILVGYSFKNDAVSLFERVRAELLPAYAARTGDHAITVNASEDHGFYVMGQVNGATIRFAIDTGANGVVLSPADAERAGIDPASLKFALPSETANGVGYTAPVTLSRLDVGGQIHLTGVQAEVDKTPMTVSLLGMAFLHRLDSFEVKGDQMTLRWRGQ